MLEIIIISNNFNFVTNIINNILINSNIKIIGIFENVEKAKKFILKYSPDLIFLSISDFNDLNQLLETYSYKPDIILFTNSKNNHISSNILYLSIHSNYDTMKKNIISFINDKNTYKITSKVQSIILGFNFDISLIGTKYLIDSIVYSYINKKDYVCENLEKKVYSQIAKKYNSTAYNVKWSIVRSINNMYYNNTTSSIKRVTSYFNLKPLDKPTAKLIISTIVNNI